MPAMILWAALALAPLAGGVVSRCPGCDCCGCCAKGTCTCEACGCCCCESGPCEGCCKQGG